MTAHACLLLLIDACCCLLLVVSACCYCYCFCFCYCYCCCCCTWPQTTGERQGNNHQRNKRGNTPTHELHNISAQYTHTHTHAVCCFGISTRLATASQQRARVNRGALAQRHLRHRFSAKYDSCCLALHEYSSARTHANMQPPQAHADQLTCAFCTPSSCSSASSPGSENAPAGRIGSPPLPSLSFRLN